MLKSFLCSFGLCVCLLSAAAGCNDVDEGQPVRPQTSNNSTPGAEFNPYDQQPNQTALDNN